MSKQIKSPNLVSRRQSQKDSSTAKPDKTQSGLANTEYQTKKRIKDSKESSHQN